MLVRRIWSCPGAQYFAARAPSFAEDAVADAAAGEADADPVKIALLLLVDAEVIGLLILDDGEVGVALELEVEQRLDFAASAALSMPPASPVGDEELEARAVALKAVAVVAEDCADRLDDRPDLLGLEEDGQRLREVRRGAKARRRS